MTTYPPDKWTPTSGVWGTDFDFVTTPTSPIGDGSVNFKNTAPASDPLLSGVDYIPVQENFPYMFRAIWRVDSTGAGEYIGIAVYWYNAAKGYLSSNNATIDNPAPVLNQWWEQAGIVHAPSNAAYMKIFAFKANLNTFNAYLAGAWARRLPRAFLAYRGAVSQTLAAGTPTKIEFDVEGYDWGYMYEHTVNYRFVCPRTGLYALTTNLWWAKPFLDQTTASVLWYKNGAYWMRGDERSVSGTFNPMTGSALTEVLQYGDYVEVFGSYSGTTPAYIQGHATIRYSWFTGAEIE